MGTRTDRAFSLVAAVLALLAFLAAGVVGITVSRDDQVATFGLFLVSGQWQLPLAAVVLAVLAAALGLRHARWAWAAVVIGGCAAVVCFGVGSSIAADARDVNDAVGGTLSIDSPLTRAMGGGDSPVSAVDVDDFGQAMLGAGILELACMATAGWSLWAGRRRPSMTTSPAVV